VADPNVVTSNSITCPDPSSSIRIVYLAASMHASFASSRLLPALSRPGLRNSHVARYGDINAADLKAGTIAPVTGRRLAGAGASTESRHLEMYRSQ
jgi:hypothetical protein